MKSATRLVDWRELRLVDAQGKSDDRLGDAIDDALRTGEASEFDERLLVLHADGGVDSWDGYFIAADGEEPDCQTPLCDVDWSGFRDAVVKVRAFEDRAMESYAADYRVTRNTLTDNSYTVVHEPTGHDCGHHHRTHDVADKCARQWHSRQIKRETAEAAGNAGHKPSNLSIFFFTKKGKP